MFPLDITDINSANRFEARLHKVAGKHNTEEHVTHIAADSRKYKKNGHQEQPDLHAIHTQQCLLPTFAAAHWAT